MFTIRTFDRQSFDVSDDEARAVLEAKQTVGTVILNGNAIDTKNISGIYRKENEHRDHNVGVLHDGTQVVRQFGKWVCDDGQRDERGLLVVSPDPMYYPEVAADLVASPSEWRTLGMQFYELNESRVKRIQGGHGSMEAIGSVLERRLNVGKPESVGSSTDRR